jgi:NitT/TauT family transport system substrate-binding protein
MKRWLGLAGVSAVLVAACGGGGGPTPKPATPAPGTPGAATPAASAPADLTQVKLQLQWEPQAQFAGYFAADREGYYAAEGLEVEFLPGGATVIPQDVGTDPNGPEFTISWVPKVLQVRANEAQSDLVNIAQIFQRSGTRSVSWAAGKGPGTPSDENITSPEQFAGKNIGVWDFGNEFEVTAAGLLHDLVENEDYTKVIQPFNMDLLFNREVDVAERKR